MCALGLGGCLADDMGLGKTVHVIALHLSRQVAGDGAPALVVCPASLLGNWERELRRFAPGIAVRRYHGAGRHLDDLVPGEVRADHLRHGAPRRRRRWPRCVGTWSWPTRPSTSRTRCHGRPGSCAGIAGAGPGGAHRHARREPPVRAVGDPRLDHARAARPARRVPPAVADADRALPRPGGRRAPGPHGAPLPAAPPQVDPDIAPELPAKTETDQLVPLTPEQATLYEAVVREAMAEIEEADGIARRGLVLKLLTSLKQMCNHPAQYLRQTGPLAGSFGQARRARRAARHHRRRGRVGAGVHPVRGHGRLLEAPPRRAGHAHPLPARRHARRAREEMVTGSRPARCRSSSSRSRPAAPG